MHYSKIKFKYLFVPKQHSASISSTIHWVNLVPRVQLFQGPSWDVKVWQLNAVMGAGPVFTLWKERLCSCTETPQGLWDQAGAARRAQLNPAGPSPPRQPPRTSGGRGRAGSWDPSTAAHLWAQPSCRALLSGLHLCFHLHTISLPLRLFGCIMGFPVTESPLSPQLLVDCWQDPHKNPSHRLQLCKSLLWR